MKTKIKCIYCYQVSAESRIIYDVVYYSGRLIAYDDSNAPGTVTSFLDYAKNHTIYYNELLDCNIDKTYI